MRYFVYLVFIIIQSFSCYVIAYDTTTLRTNNGQTEPSGGGYETKSEQSLKTGEKNNNEFTEIDNQFQNLHPQCEPIKVTEKINFTYKNKKYFIKEISYKHKWYQNLYEKSDALFEINEIGRQKLIYERKENVHGVNEYFLFDNNKKIYIQRSFFKSKMIESERFITPKCNWANTRESCPIYYGINYTDNGDIKFEAQYEDFNPELNYKEIIKNISHQIQDVYKEGYETTRRKKENQEIIKRSSEINTYKTQCKELGFKEGSKKFKDCVVELME